jgi:soluble lytic murein transglycosylase-like protein
MGWKDTPNASIYLPALAAAEIKWSIPTDLLARIAYQESRFRDDVVHGPANHMGCIGLMQLEILYHPNAGKDWRQDIEEAAQELSGDFKRFIDWQVAVGAYNDGGGNMHQWMLGKREMPQETQDYVSQIIADVPEPGCIIKA